ncbi:hypothetical protein EPO04_03050 [Patescibacteria group bacterium]|nr:MAG: hypothetical protein EPO04_03050 [Patescibacteria group bacterium]
MSTPEKNFPTDEQKLSELRWEQKAALAAAGNAEREDDKSYAPGSVSELQGRDPKAELHEVNAEIARREAIKDAREAVDAAVAESQPEIDHDQPHPDTDNPEDKLPDPNH